MGKTGRGECPLPLRHLRRKSQGAGGHVFEARKKGLKRVIEVSLR